ncbi:GNAT family N-acetyltransferase [Aquimarina longa]|uniref:GNAT family N-acetyltransferase n=1 Tax=Aquimarina longa TaxID=1080221 RepID=UPI0007845FCB|nr:GNAT family N-acetyltransferase [Aquimarina longa]
MYPPVLKTNHLTLKPYTSDDEDRFIEMTLDIRSTQFMGGASGNEIEERKLFKKGLEIYKRNDKRWFWLWGIYRGDLLCGHLEIKETDHTNNNELEIVYMVHPEERKKGIMTEVLSLLKQNQKNWHKRIIATVNPKNLNSISLLKKWGIDKKEILISSETGKKYFKLTLDE